MSDISPCGGCSGCSSGEHHGCGACCSGEVLLCNEEVAILSALAQLAFLPIACREAQSPPSYLSVTDNFGLSPELFSQVIASLSFKGFISVDPDIPLSNVDYWIHHPEVGMHFGSIALTSRGQELLDFLELEVEDI